MSKLIKTALRVHIASRIFLFCALSVTAASVIGGLVHRTEEPYYDSYKAFPFVIALMAVCVTLVFGLCGEFSCGAVKNKLIHGYTKMQFCIAELIAALADAMIFGVLAWAPYFAIKYKSFFSLYTAEVLLRGFGLLFLSLLIMTLLAFTVCITVRRMTLSLIVCGAMFLGLAYTASWLENDLRLPLYTLENGEDDYIYHPEDDSFEHIIIREPDKVPYPWYVEGVQRDIYYVCYVMNPMSSLICGTDYLRHSNDCFSMEAKEFFIENHDLFNDTYIYNTDFERDYKINNIYYPIWSGSTVLVITAVGILIFKKRNIT